MGLKYLILFATKCTNLLPTAALIISLVGASSLPGTRNNPLTHAEKLNYISKTRVPRIKRVPVKSGTLIE